MTDPSKILRPRSATRQAASAVASLLLILMFLPADAAGRGGFGDGEGVRAWDLQVRGRSEEALEVAFAALDRDPFNAPAMYAAVSAFHDLNRDSEADLLCDRFEEHFAESGCGPLGKGRLAILSGRAAVAESLLSLALQRFTARDDSVGTLFANVLLAESHGMMGNRDKQDEYLGSSFEIAERIGWRLAVAWLHLRKGSALVETRNSEEATRHLGLALQQSDSLGVGRWAGDAHMRLSVVARWKMDLDESLVHREAALEKYRSAGYAAGEAQALSYIAAIHSRRGDLALAMGLLREGLAAAETAGARSEAAGCLGMLAVIHTLVGNEEAAIRGFREALETAGDLRSKEWVGGMESNLGLVLSNQRRFDEALISFERALEHVRSVGNRRYEGIVLGNIGRCLCQMGRQVDGIPRLEEAAAISREWEIPLTLGYVLLDIGSCNRDLGDLEAAEAAYLEAGKVAKEIGYFELQASVLLAQSRLERIRANNTLALRLLEDAMEIIEGVRARSLGGARMQASYFGHVSYFYEEAVDLLWTMNAAGPGAAVPRQAFELAQRAKARSLLDMLAEAKIDLRFRADSRYQEREQEILQRIAELSDASDSDDSSAVSEVEVDRLEEELALLETELREADPRYAEIQYPVPLGVEEIQNDLLEEGELLLEYFLGDSASYLWAVSRESFRFVQLPQRSVIDEAVRGLLPMLSDYNLTGEHAAYFVEPAMELSTMLIGPVREEVSDADDLIVAAHGILHYLPFEILLTSQTGSAEARFDSLPYLVHDTDVVYTPSISAMALLRRASVTREGAGSKELLVVGDPTLSSAEESDLFGHRMRGGEAGPLPFAKEEMTAIQSLFPAEQTNRLAGADATVANLEALEPDHQYRLVHFTVHGIYNERRPRYSGLLLSSVESGSGFVSVGELFGLDLPCDQLVLSACSSALNERVTGEGLVGLTRAFLHAGARSVVAALWEVSGESTSQFMTDFYGKISQGGGGDRTRALAEAKRLMARGEKDAGAPSGVSYAHPYFWAAFVMTGDGR